MDAGKWIVSLALWVILCRSWGTARAADAVTQPSPQVTSIVGQLSSDSFQTREEATKKLVDMGPDIGPQLEQLLKGSLPEEARLRVNEVIDRLNTVPSIITMHYNDAPMMSVLEDFALQSRADLGVHRRQIADYAKSRRLSINVDHASFWGVLRKIEEATDLRMSRMGSSAGSRLTLHIDGSPNRLESPNMLGGPVTVAGPFLVVPTGSAQSHNFNFQTDKSGQVTMGLEILLLTEPKIRPLSPLKRNWLTEVIDDHGNSLMQPDTQVGQSLNWRQPMNVGLDVPPNLGKKIARLRGELRFTVETRSQIVEITDFSKFDHFTHDFMGKNVTLKSIVRTQRAWAVTFACDGLTMDPRSNSVGGPLSPASLLREQLRSSIELLDAAGNTLFQLGGDGTTGQETYDFRPLDEKAQLPDLAMLRWDIPVATREVAVPFELNNLDLPIDP